MICHGVIPLTCPHLIISHLENKLQFLRSGANFDHRFCKPLILLHSLKALTFDIFKFERGYILLPL